jgi:hypothetical protein
MAKPSTASRAFWQSIAHWGLIEYALLFAVWGGLSTPLYLGGWGILSVLGLPLFVAVIICLTYAINRFVSRGGATASEIKKTPACRQFPANAGLGIETYFAEIDSDKYSGLPQFELNLLDRDEAEALTERLSSHPIIRLLDGFVLDEPNTSNYHILLCRHPLEGQVLYLSHDGDSRVVFSNLSELLTAASEAKARQLALPELHPDLSPHVTDQPALSHMLAMLAEGASEEADVAVSIIPSMDLSDTTLLEALATHENFYISEAVGAEIAKRPSSALKPIAWLCSNHPHPQAAEAGAKAISVIGDAAYLA